MTEKTLNEKTVFEGRALRVDVLDIELEGGRTSVREIIRHPGAVVVLAELPGEKFALVRQYRKAIESLLLEAVAGTLERGEDPLACAHRELKEETGYDAEEITALGEIVPAPGYSEERLYLYHAVLNAEAGEMCPDEDEDLEVVILSRAELDESIRSGEIIDAKTIAVWHRFLSREGGCS